MQCAEKREMKRRNYLIYKTHRLLADAIYGGIIYNMLGLQEYNKYLNQNGNAVNKAIGILQNGESYPKLAPAKTEKNTDESNKK